MFRLRDYVKVLLLVVGFGFAFASFGDGTRPAYGYVHTIPPVSDPAFEAEFQAFVDGASGLRPPGYVNSSLVDAAATAGRLPIFGTIAVAVTGFTIGWKIGRTIDTKFLHLQDPNCIIFGCTASPSGAPQATTLDVVYKSGGVGATPANVYSYQGCTSACTTSGSTVSNKTYSSTGGVCPALGGYYFWDASAYSGGNANCAQLLNIDMVKGGTYWNAAVAAGAVSVDDGTAASHSIYGAVAGVDTSKHVWELYKLHPSTVLGQAGASGLVPWTNQAPVDSTTMSPAPGATMTAAEFSAARGVVNGASVGVAGSINCLLSPADYSCPATETDAGGAVVTTTPGGAFALPEPGVTESYDQYAQRLRGLGYVGTVVFDPDAMTFPDSTPGAELNPSSITRVTFGTTEVDVYDTSTGLKLAWPGSVPSPSTVDATESITIGYVPPSWVPTDHGAPPGGTGVGAPNGGSTCNCGSIDFTPLTGLDYGGQFPFGVFSWVAGLTGGLTGTGAPISMAIGKPAAIGGGTYELTLGSSEWEDTYRPIVFPILEFCMTLAGVWFLAFRLIGFGNGDGSD